VSELSPWVREGYQSLNPYLVVEGVESLLAFLSDVFGAKERGEREIRADGTIGHTELLIGDSVVMLSEASENPARPGVVYAYVEHVDDVFERARAAGATHLREPADWPWGDRVAGFHDPCDNRWWVATCLAATSGR
jgi:PhnB protein